MVRVLLIVTALALMGAATSETEEVAPLLQDTIVSEGVPSESVIQYEDNCRAYFVTSDEDRERLKIDQNGGNSEGLFCHQNEDLASCCALQELYIATGFKIPNWGWGKTGKRMCYAGAWTGFYCDNTYAPSEIGRSESLSGLGLRGTIPDSVLALTSLRKMDLSKNSLSGTIANFAFARKNEHGWIANAWEELNLGHNRISGTVPETLGYNYNLRQLNLEFNRFTVWKTTSSLCESDKYETADQSSPLSVDNRPVNWGDWNRNYPTQSDAKKKDTQTYYDPPRVVANLRQPNFRRRRQCNLRMNPFECPQSPAPYQLYAGDMHELKEDGQPHDPDGNPDTYNGWSAVRQDCSKDITQCTVTQDSNGKDQTFCRGTPCINHPHATLPPLGAPWNHFVHNCATDCQVTGCCHNGNYYTNVEATLWTSGRALDAPVTRYHVDIRSKICSGPAPDTTSSS